MLQQYNVYSDKKNIFCHNKNNFIGTLGDHLLPCGEKSSVDEKKIDSRT
jgi:hypothetical protein